MGTVRPDLQPGDAPQPATPATPPASSTGGAPAGHDGAADRSSSSLASSAANLSLRTSLLYSSGNFGSGFYWGLNSFILPNLFFSLGIQPWLSNLLSGTRSIEGTIVQPVVGAWSDRTWRGRLGRRRYFIVLFLPASALFVALTPFAPRLIPSGRLFGLAPQQTAILAVCVTVIAFTLLFNVMYDPYNALLADITPERQRGHVNGLFQGISAAGQVVVLGITLALVFTRGSIPDAAVAPICVVTAVMMLVAFVPTVLGIREPAELPHLEKRPAYTATDYWRGLRADRQVQLYFANQFLLWFGISTVQFNLIYYARLQLHLNDMRLFVLPIVLLLTSALPVWPLGILSDRIGLKRIYVFGVACMSAGCVAGSFIRDFAPILIVLAIAGVGNAAQSASSYPLLTRLVFPDQMGLYTGLNTAISSVAGPLGAVLSGLLVGTLQEPHFERLFPFVALMFLASLIPLALIRIDRSLVAQARPAQAGTSPLADGAAPAAN